MAMAFEQWAVLRRWPDFARLFAGTAVSAIGTSISAVAIPLTAVLVLEATPTEMGILGALGFVPHLVLALPAGVWIGQTSYRRVIVLADLTRALLLGAIPVLAVLGALSTWQLYVIVLAAGGCALFETIAATSYLPSLVARPDLLAANSVMAQSNAVVNASGSALGGALVQLLTAPIAVLVDAVSFLASAICKSRIQVAGRAMGRDIEDLDPAEPDTAHRRGGGMDLDRSRAKLAEGIMRGLRAVFGDAVLRPLILSAAIGALTGQMQIVILVLFLSRELGLAPSLVGVAIAVGGIASVLGSVLVTPITERIGHGPTFILGDLLAALALFALSLSAGPWLLMLGVVFVSRLLSGFGPPLYGVNQTTIRQTLAPPEVLDQVNATWRFLVFGVLPIGSLLGGVLGDAIGLRATFAVAGVLAVVGLTIALCSPLRTFHGLPEPIG